MTKLPEVKFKDEPDDHDYPAAQSILSLVVRDAEARSIVHDLEDAKVRSWRVNDILRMAGLPALPPEDPDVRKNLDRIARGEPLPPVLLVRWPGGRVVIADGYHRISAVLHTNHRTEMPAKIADGPTRG